MSNVLEEYLVSLGFSVNNAAFAQFNSTMREAEKVVNTASLGMSRAISIAAGIMVTSIVGVTAATANMLHELGKADMEYKKFGLRMYLTNQSARELKITLDALGESIEDAAFIPELNKQFRELYAQGRQMEPPSSYAEYMQRIQAVSFEFKRMKLEATYAMQWIGYHLMRYLDAPFRSIHAALKSFNDYITKNMAQWTEKVASVLSTIVNIGRSLVWLFTRELPGGLQVFQLALLAMGAKLMMSPVGMFLTMMGTALLMLEDFYGYTQGWDSSKTLAPMWKWLIELKENTEKSDWFLALKKSLKDLGDQFELLKKQLLDTNAELDGLEGKEGETRSFSALRKAIVDLKIEARGFWQALKDALSELSKIDALKNTNWGEFFKLLWQNLIDQMTHYIRMFSFVLEFWKALLSGDIGGFLSRRLTDLQNFLNGKKPGEPGYHPGGTPPRGSYGGGHPTSPENWNDAYGSGGRKEAPPGGTTYTNLSGKTGGLEDSFLAKLSAMASAKGKTLHIGSGFRTREEQEALWEKSDKTGKWVARPGTSRHEAGYAIDADWAEDMTDEELEAYGFYRPMAYEPWHIEPLETRGRSTAELMERRRSAKTTQPVLNKDVSLGNVTGAPSSVISTVNNIEVTVPPGADADGYAMAIAKALEPYQGRATQITIARQMRALQGVGA